MKRVGEVLIEAGMLTHAELQRALEHSRKQELPLGEALIELGLISESDLLNCLGKQLDIPVLPDKELAIDPTLIHMIPLALAQKFNIIPLCIQNGRLLVVTSDPLNLWIVDELENRTRKPVSLVLAGSRKIAAAIEQYFAGAETMSQALKQVQQLEDETLQLRPDEGDSGISETPVVKFVNEMLMKAVSERASDVHIEIDSLDFHIRFRLDGILQTMFRPKPQLHPLIISRIKVMARMDVSEHRLPQDGRIKLKIQEELVDFRVSTIPCLFGENMVVRILAQGPRFTQLGELGFSKAGLDRLAPLMAKKNGLILVAGRTGSGKTTTLYTMLRQLNHEGTKIITLEDPVEIQLPVLNQIQVNPRIDLTFANGLRSVLRMDPDIIMIGEIRDGDTAKLAVNAALTGHLVLSTIHTGIAAEVPVRLMEMGVEPYLVANTLLGAIAQRLVRLNCLLCKNPEEIPAPYLDPSRPEYQAFRGQGCTSCNQTGYRGRSCIEEVLLVDSEIRRLILGSADTDQIHETALKTGMRPLREAALDKIREGRTSFQEMARVL